MLKQNPTDLNTFEQKIKKISDMSNLDLSNLKEAKQGSSFDSNNFPKTVNNLTNSKNDSKNEASNFTLDDRSEIYSKIGVSEGIVVEDSRPAASFIDKQPTSNFFNFLQENKEHCKNIEPEKTHEEENPKNDDFAALLKNLSKKHKQTAKSSTEKSSDMKMFRDQIETTRTTSSKKFPTPRTKRKRRQDATERILTNIGCKGEKIYKLSELYMPNCPKIKRTCMNFIENHSRIKMLKEFESNCLLEPYDLNEQFREFEKNVKGIEEESEHDEELDKSQEEGAELEEFYRGSQGQREKYWDGALENTHSLARIFRKRLSREDGGLRHMNHLLLEKVVLNNHDSRAGYLEGIRLAKRSGEGRA